MRTWFQADIDRTSLEQFLVFDRSDCMNLCVRFSASDMVTFSDDFPVTHDDRSDHRVGTGCILSVACQLYATFHVDFFLVHGYILNFRYICVASNEVTNQSMNTNFPPTDFFDFNCRQECCSEVFRHVIACLETHGLKGEARALARWVFELRFGIGQVQLLTDKDSYFSDEERHELLFIVHRLIQGEPIQYILGIAPFCGLNIGVRPGVLIPRPETEELVAWIVRQVESDFSALPIQILDVGTGSGCIALALADQVPEAQVTAMDVSEDALAIARQNAQDLRLAVRFVHGDILQPAASVCPKWHIVVSNPPYICYSEAKDMEHNVLDYEPHQALFVPDNDPLLFYRAIARYALETLLPDGFLFFEINRAYANEVVQMLSDLGFVRIEVRKDCFGNDRMVGCRMAG